jgi:hypothetical protein
MEIAELVKVLTLVLDYVEIVSDDLNTWNSAEHTFELHVLVSGENCKNT